MWFCCSPHSPENLRAEAEKLSGECGEQQNHIVDLTSAYYLAKAGFKLRPKEFGLPDHATSSGEQEIAARFALEETSAARTKRLTRLEPFMAALRQRVTLVLRLAQASGKNERPESMGEVGELARLLAAIGAEVPHAHEIGMRLNAFAVLAHNRSDHANLVQVDRKSVV